MEVKLYAYLREGRGKSMDVPFEEGMIIQNILDQLQIPSKDIAIIICDGYDHKYEKMKDYKPSENSIIHIFPPVAGG